VMHRERSASTRAAESFRGEELPLSFCSALSRPLPAHAAGGEHDFYSGAQLMAVAPIHHDGVEFGKEVSACAEEFALYMRDPMNPSQAKTENNLILQAVTACSAGALEEREVHSVLSEMIHEVEEWAPVCRAVFGVIGAILVASERGKANEIERHRIYERMINLGRSLLQIRSTFRHQPPPQMEALLRTLKSALSFIEIFDGRGWFMRALKSASDKSALESFHHAISAHCTDMSLSLQATAYRDEHLILNEVVERIAWLQALQRKVLETRTRAVQEVVDSSQCASGAQELMRKLETIASQQAAQEELLQRLLGQMPDIQQDGVSSTSPNLPAR